MKGDFLIWIKRIFKQHVTCNHDYKPDRIGIITGLCNDRVCIKCGKRE
jgi:hypothetical protein